MNKQVIVLLAAIAAFLPGASAQRGDTMSFSNFRPWYYTDFWPEPYMLSRNPLHSETERCIFYRSCPDIFNCSYENYAQLNTKRPKNIQTGMHSDSAITIDGIAIAMSRNYGLILHNYLSNQYDRLQLMVLDSARNTIASGTTPFTDSLAGGLFNIPDRVAYMHPIYKDSLLYIFEVYFDSPVTIADSFYIEARAVNNALDTSISVPPMRLLEGHNIYASDTGEIRDYEGYLIYTGPDYLYPEIRTYERGGWQLVNSNVPTDFNDSDEWNLNTFRFGEATHGMTLVFPILATDCQSPALRVENVNNRHARLHWEAGRFAQKWEVSYGPAGTPPGGGTVAQTLFTQHAMPNLDPEAEYVAYVRSYCAGHDTLWSDWGDGITFRLADVAGLDPADGIALEATPNPAAKAAHVAASAPLLRLEAFNSAGVRMADLQASGMEADLDVSGWPSGVYLLRVHTAIGSAQRPLVVLH